MKTLTNATLYVVKGPKGAYYAVWDEDTGAVLTERTEQAASALAYARDMVLVDRKEVSHAEMLKLTSGREAGATVMAMG